MNDQEQVEDTLWAEHEEIEDHIVPQPKELDGNNFLNSERCSKKQKSEDVSHVLSSMETCGTKNNLFICNVKNCSCSNTNQELINASVEMNAWPDLPNLSMTYGEGFNDGIVQSSVATGLVSDPSDTSDMNSVGFMEGYNYSSALILDDDSSSLSKTSILLSANDMQLDGESDLFRQDDKFMDYDWANIEDFEDFDKMFRNNDSVFGSEMIGNKNTSFSASADLISSTSQSIPVPDISILREKAWEKDSSSLQLREHFNLEVNPLKADVQNQTLESKNNQEEKGKVGSSESMNNSWLNEISVADYGYHTYQFNDIMSSPQIHPARSPNKPATGGFKTHSEFSKHLKPAGAASKPLMMTPQEKIEKLRRRQRMQAMLAIQKQREQYSHQISGGDETPLTSLQNDSPRSTSAMEEHAQELLFSDGGSLAEQDQSHMMSSSSFGGRSIEEAIYNQLQDGMRKLDMKVRLSIRDSLHRLATSAMERQNICDGSSINKSNKEDNEISAAELYNHDRYSRLPNSEAVTNPIDRIVAHLLFHNPSGPSLMPIADGNMSLAASM